MNRELIHIVASTAMDGASRYALGICSHYAAFPGWEVTAVTRDARAVDSRFKEAGVPLRHAPLRDYPDLFSSLMLAAHLREIPRQKEVVIHTHRFRDALTAIAARIISKHKNVRIIVTSHKGIEDPQKATTPLRRWIYRHVDHILFVSEFAKNRFLQNLRQRKVAADNLPTGVTRNSSPLPLEPSPIPERGALTALFYGTLRPGKGLICLLDAMARLDDIKLRLKIAGTGDPDYIDHLRRHAAMLGISEKIDWLINTPDPTALLGECHFCIFPSETPEAFGMANMEALKAGRSQITTFNGAQGEYLTPGREAIKVEPGDADALAVAMRRLASSRELLAEMGSAAAQTYRRQLCWSKFIANLEKFYLP